MISISVVNVKVLNIRPQYNNLAEWIKHPDHVYIGKRLAVPINNRRFPPTDSPWANPFNGQQDSIEQYESQLRSRLVQEPGFRAELLSLQGKRLGCWCKPGPCHGDVLVKLVNELANEGCDSDCDSVQVIDNDP